MPALSRPSISDYIMVFETPSLLKANVFKGGHPVYRNGRLIRYTGGFCLVVPFESINGRVAIRCWHTGIGDCQNRSRAISEFIRNNPSPYFVDFEYIDDGIMTPMGSQPIVKMEWIEGITLKEYIDVNIKDESRLRRLADTFLEMVKYLHQANVSHGDLQHGNIIVNRDGKLCLVDYDSMFVPALQHCEDEIKGLAGYQAPARRKNKYLSPYADYFSEWIIYTSIIVFATYPHLWEELQVYNTETLLFSSKDIEEKCSSELFRELCKDPNISPFIEKIKEYIDAPTLENIEPLDNFVRSSVDSIFDKIRNRPVIKVSNVYATKQVAEKWKKTPRDKKYDVINITSKFSNEHS